MQNELLADQVMSKLQLIVVIPSFQKYFNLQKLLGNNKEHMNILRGFPCINCFQHVDQFGCFVPMLVWHLANISEEHEHGTTGSRGGKGVL